MPKVTTARGQTPRDAGVAGLASGVVITKPAPKNRPPKALPPPPLNIETRRSGFAAMMADPVNSEPAMPPCTLPARGIPVKVYQEVLLSTDASGNCGLTMNPLMANHYSIVATWSGSSVASYGTGTAHSEYTNFASNFLHYVPLCYEVMCRYTGSATASAGRFYGIIAPAGDVTVTNFPREANGCEAVTSEGISCVWYSTDPVWSNPCLATATANPGEWMDPTAIVALIGGPASTTNVVSVGIWLHFVAFPKSGVVGLTPMAGLPDPNAALVAALMRADETGAWASSMAATKRDRQRKKTKGHIRDVLKIGGKVLGTVLPQYGAASEAVDLLAKLLV
jgi:hypothetical protein